LHERRSGNPVRMQTSGRNHPRSAAISHAQEQARPARPCMSLCICCTSARRCMHACVPGLDHAGMRHRRVPSRLRSRCARTEAVSSVLPSPPPRQHSCVRCVHCAAPTAMQRSAAESLQEGRGACVVRRTPHACAAPHARRLQKCVLLLVM
jgi:hypothetical protein